MKPVLHDLPYLMEDKDRHGNHRVFVRYRGRKVRIREAPSTDAFAKAYSKALEDLQAPACAATIGVTGVAPGGSLGWLAAEYFRSPEFRNLADTSQRTRRGIIESCLRERLKPGGKLIMRNCPYKRVDATHVLLLRDRRADKPGAANNRLKYLSAMFGWAIEAKRYGLGANPCRDAAAIQYASAGFKTWTIEDVRQFEQRHPVGTMANLALRLMLYLGARRQDAIRLGPRNRRGDVMVYVPKKTTYRRLDESHKPILPPLAEAIRSTPIGLQTFLVTSFGKPFTDGGIGNKMREWCDEAGLPECTAHGLKKIGACLCADAGATDRQLMALFDWSSEKQANTYTAAARKRLMAEQAANLLGGALSIELCPTGQHAVEI